ncbi:MAG: glycosyltransferase [Bacteroidaceae bacterium]|nr:glycosyltransferase [Bacteroidaceae bacterium]
MKILQLGKFYPIFGGVEKVEWDLTRGLSQKGVSCDMLCCGLRSELNSHEHGAFFGKRLEISFNELGRCIVVPTWIKLAATMISPRLVLELRRMRRDYDIIHVHHPDPMAALALRLSGFKGKVVLHWHSDILKQKTLLKFYAPVLRWMIRRADAIVGTTPVYVKDSVFLKDVQDKVTAIPIGINPVKPDPEGAERIRSKYKGKKIVYALGRLVGYKGYEYLIEAARWLPDDYHILIGGDGPDRNDLMLKIMECGVVSKVTLLGYIDEADFAAYYTACDVFALSSIYKTEAFAIVQIEAMSCGKPVVATQIEGSGVSWVNRDGYSGINVKPMDGRAIADAVMRICEDRQRYEEFCRNAREHYDSLFTYNTMIDSCIDLYNGLL